MLYAAHLLMLSDAVCCSLVYEHVHIHRMLSMCNCVDFFELDFVLENSKLFLNTLMHVALLGVIYFMPHIVSLIT